MYILILMRILIGVGVLNHAPERLRFQYHPRAFLFLKVVSDLHARAGCPTRLWAKLYLRMSFIAVDGDATNIHIHGAHIQSADGIQVLKDGGSDRCAVACLLLARAGAKEPSC